MYVNSLIIYGISQPQAGSAATAANRLGGLNPSHQNPTSITRVLMRSEKLTWADSLGETRDAPASYRQSDGSYIYIYVLKKTLTINAFLPYKGRAASSCCKRRVGIGHIGSEPPFSAGSFSWEDL